MHSSFLFAQFFLPSTGSTSSPQVRSGQAADFAVIILTEERFDKGIGVEFGNSVGFFAEADKFYGDVELVSDCDDDAAFGCAVELG